MRCAPHQALPAGAAGPFSAGVVGRRRSRLARRRLRDPRGHAPLGTKALSPVTAPVSSALSTVEPVAAATIPSVNADDLPVRAQVPRASSVLPRSAAGSPPRAPPRIPFPRRSACCRRPNSSSAPAIRPKHSPRSASTSGASRVELLAEERLAARVQSLCGLGRVNEARMDLAKLGRAYPGSPISDGARRFCGIDVPWRLLRASGASMTILLTEQAGACHCDSGWPCIRPDGEEAMKPTATTGELRHLLHIIEFPLGFTSIGSGAECDVSLASSPHRAPACLHRCGTQRGGAMRTSVRPASWYNGPMIRGATLLLRRRSPADGRRTLRLRHRTLGEKTAREDTTEETSARMTYSPPARRPRRGLQAPTESCRPSRGRHASPTRSTIRGVAMGRGSASFGGAQGGGAGAGSLQDGDLARRGGHAAVAAAGGGCGSAHGASNFAQDNASSGASSGPVSGDDGSAVSSKREHFSEPFGEQLWRGPALPDGWHRMELQGGHDVRLLAHHAVDGQGLRPGGHQPALQHRGLRSRRSDDAPGPITLGTHTCNTCDVPIGNYVTATQTDTSGSFTLKAGPDSARASPITIQAGKWRRTIPDRHHDELRDEHAKCRATRSACPRSTPRGDMPQMALLTGGFDNLGCFLYKMGVDPREYSAPHAGGRLDIYEGVNAPLGAMIGNGLGLSNGERPGTATRATRVRSGPASRASRPTTWSCWPARATRGHRPSRPLSITAMHDWLNEGGKVFATHFHYLWFQSGPSDFQGTATWKESRPASAWATTTSTRPAKGQLFQQWLSNVGVTSASSGTIALTGVADSVGTVRPGSRRPRCDDL